MVRKGVETWVQGVKTWVQEGCGELGTGRVWRTGLRKGVENWVQEGCGDLGSELLKIEIIRQDDDVIDT